MIFFRSGTSLSLNSLRPISSGQPCSLSSLKPTLQGLSPLYSIGFDGSAPSFALKPPLLTDKIGIRTRTTKLCFDVSALIRCRVVWASDTPFESLGSHRIEQPVDALFKLPRAEVFEWYGGRNYKTGIRHDSYRVLRRRQNCNPRGAFPFPLGARRREFESVRSGFGPLALSLSYEPDFLFRGKLMFAIFRGDGVFRPLPGSVWPGWGFEKRRVG